MDQLDRLDSWKQIAAYLGKSERTVRRWQETEGLPVHRHVHQQRGSVWAYRAELDAWLESRRSSPQAEPEAPPDRLTPRYGRWIVAAAALATVTLVAAGVYRTWRRTDQLPTIPEPVQITALPGATYGPAFSPDGRQIAFHWAPRDQTAPGIYIKTLGDENVSRLVTTDRRAGVFNYNPAWSPDGKTIAFLQRVRPEPGFVMYATASETWLNLIAATGGPERRLIRLARDDIFYANSSHLSWSRSGEWIFAPMFERDRRGIYRISVRTGEAIRVTSGQVKEFAPALSPDGSFLVYMRQEGPSAASIERVMIQSLAGGSPAGAAREIFTGRSMSSGLAWLPSGKELIFCSARSAFFGPFNSRLYRLSVEENQPPVPLGYGDDCSTVAVSPPDSSGRVNVAYGSGENAKGTLYQAQLNALDRTSTLAPSSRFDILPNHSPDGSMIAFVSNRSGRPELWVTKRDGSGTTRLTENSSIASAPGWSPDGTRLVYGSAAPPSDRDLSGYALFTVAIAGGVQSRIPVTQRAPSDPTWSPDGNWILYWSGSHVWRARPDGSDAQQIGEFPAHFVRPQVSDGSHVYYTRPSAPFALCRTASGAQQSEILAEGLAAPFFALTRKYAYYVQQADQSLYARPLGGGPARRIGKLPEMQGVRRILLGMSVSPNDSSLVWAVTGDQQLDLHLVRGVR